MRRRFVSLWFPRLATDRVARDRGAAWSARPAATTAECGNRILLTGINRAAEEAGLAPGMTLADARAVVAGLATVPAEPAAEAELLGRLGRWCGRYTPLVARDGPDGLFLDVTGCAHLFGGEAALLRDVMARLDRLGFAVSAALADTAAAARAVARFAAPGTVVPPGSAARALERLPVAALGLDRESAAGLAHLGLRRIGDLYGLPRGSLAARFGRATVLQLDRALGHAAEPFDSLRDDAIPRERIAFAEPIGARSDIDTALGHLLGRMAARLERAGRGARRLELACHRVDGTAQMVAVGTARPLRDVAALARLFRERLDHLDPGFGIEAMILCAPGVERQAPAQETLDAARAAADADGIASLVERLGNRFGFDAVLRATPIDSHLPDRAWRLRPAAMAGEPGGAAAVWSTAILRPPRLLRRPEPVQAEPGAEAHDLVPPAAFRWRGRRHVVRRAEGPERIAPEWWRADAHWASGARDYWCVEDEAGRRFWLCCTGRPRCWHLHGLFA